MIRLCAVGVPVVFIGGYISANLIALRSARPPSNLKTISEFEIWKRDYLMGTGQYENSGTNYTVLFAPAGRLLASGPSAYLFDRSGNFVDWTSDMGDLKTQMHQFDLTSDKVKRVELRKR
jgi:hypothetical protein